MKQSSKTMFIIIFIIVLLTGWFGIRYLVPRMMFDPNDPALEQSNEETNENQELPETETEEPGEEAGLPEIDPDEEFVSFDELEMEITVLAENLEVPWEIIPLDDEDDWLIVQRNGEVISLKSGVLFTIEGVSAVGEGGLLGATLHPDFTENLQIYFYYTTNTNAGLTNRVVRYEFQNNVLSEETIIIDGIPGHSNHNGGRIAFGPDGYLYITTGDAGNTQLSQETDSLAGKILRLTDNGEVPGDNPFSGNPVYSYGHRNSQGLAWHPVTGELYASEHGPRSMDEVNLIQPGQNYGWPVVTCERAPTDYEDPIACYSDFTIAPSGMDFIEMETLEGTHLLVAGLRGNQVRLLSLDQEGLPITQEPLFTEFGRIRTVRYHEGAIYFITNNRDGRGTPIATDDRMMKVTLQH